MDRSRREWFAMKTARKCCTETAEDRREPLGVIYRESHIITDWFQTARRRKTRAEQELRMNNDILEKAARIERERARRKARASLPAIAVEIGKARTEYREASQKARGLWIRLCKRAGVPPDKYINIEGLAILKEDPLNIECKEAVFELNKKVARLNKLLRIQTRIKRGHR